MNTALKTQYKLDTAELGDKKKVTGGLVCKNHF